MPGRRFSASAMSVMPNVPNCSCVSMCTGAVLVTSRILRVPITSTLSNRCAVEFVLSVCAAALLKAIPANSVDTNAVALILIFSLIACLYSPGFPRAVEKHCMSTAGLLASLSAADAFPKKCQWHRVRPYKRQLTAAGLLRIFT